MDIKEFISKALIEIRRGVDDANKELRSEAKPYRLNCRPTKPAPINFDLAVTVTDNIGGEGKGGINIYAAKIDGKADFKLEQQEISRIQFSIEPGQD